MKHLFCNALVHVIYSIVSGQFSFVYNIRYIGIVEILVHHSYIETTEITSLSY